MTYLSPRDRLDLQAFRDHVAQTLLPHNISEVFHESGLLWQSSALATTVAGGLAKVCLCRIHEPETDDCQSGDLWLAAVVTDTPTPAPDFASEVPEVFELACPEEFNYRPWLTYFKPLPGHQQAWLFCAAGPQLCLESGEEEHLKVADAIDYVERFHPPLVRNVLLECRVGPGASVPEDEVLLFMDGQYKVNSPQMYYELLEEAEAIAAFDNPNIEAFEESESWPQSPPAAPQKSPLHQPLFGWFATWRRRSSLN